MSQISKPNTLSKVWASGGDRATPLDSKITTGWQIEIPPRQWFNWLDNRQDQAIAHFNQHGIPVWDSQTEYQGSKSYTQDPDNGNIYRCLVTNTGNKPSDSPEHWVTAFAGAGSGFSQDQADARYLAKASNLSDVPNKTTARTNLGVYSTAQTDTRITTLINSQTVGHGRWYDMTSQRQNGVNYTNNSGKPIVVTVFTEIPTNTLSMVTARVGSMVVGHADSEDNSDATITFIVPPWSSYSVSLMGAALGTRAYWRELR